jgi:hypothetical protein
MLTLWHQGFRRCPRQGASWRRRSAARRQPQHHRLVAAYARCVAAEEEPAGSVLPQVAHVHVARTDARVAGEVDPHGGGLGARVEHGHGHVAVRERLHEVRWREAGTGLQAAAQEDDSFLLSSTLHGAVTVLAGLEQAVRLADYLGQRNDAARYRARSAELRATIQRWEGVLFYLAAMALTDPALLAHD